MPRFTLCMPQCHSTRHWCIFDRRRQPKEHKAAYLRVPAAAAGQQRPFSLVNHQLKTNVLRGSSHAVTLPASASGPIAFSTNGRHPTTLNRRGRSRQERAGCAEQKVLVGGAHPVHCEEAEAGDKLPIPRPTRRPS